MNTNTTAAPEMTPDEPELVITIAGRAKTGKSTLALALAMFLEKLGIEVTAINDEVTEEQQADLTTNLHANLASIANRKSRITISMAQLERDKVQLILPPGAR